MIWRFVRPEKIYLDRQGLSIIARAKDSQRSTLYIDIFVDQAGLSLNNLGLPPGNLHSLGNTLQIRPI